MSLINLSIEHGRGLDEARTRLESVVSQVQGKFGALLKQAEWSSERDEVKLTGSGFVVELKVDAKHVHMTADIPMLGGLLGGPLVAGLKQILTQAFKKRLT